VHLVGFIIRIKRRLFVTHYTLLSWTFWSNRNCAVNGEWVKLNSNMCYAVDERRTTSCRNIIFLLYEIKCFLSALIKNINNEGTCQNWGVVSLKWITSKSVNFILRTRGVVTSYVGGRIVADRLIGSNPSRTPLGMRKEKQFTVFFWGGGGHAGSANRHLCSVTNLC